MAKFGSSSVDRGGHGPHRSTFANVFGCFRDGQSSLEYDVDFCSFRFDDNSDVGRSCRVEFGVCRIPRCHVCCHGRAGRMVRGYALVMASRRTHYVGKREYSRPSEKLHPLLFFHWVSCGVMQCEAESSNIFLLLIRSTQETRDVQVTVPLSH